ncbi:MAG: GIY-YIG nuclease family protein [Proteobacteria bacterium]|nr:GIY-YIG nuclease family protein [Pseudomonadota bacterium]
MKTRKEIKDEYKKRKFRMGIYQIRNTVNGKIFVGNSMDLDAIWNRQRMELQLGTHRNKKLQKDWNSYGEENFKYEILAELKQDEKKKINYRDELKELGKLYMDELQPFKEKGYNTRTAKI